MHSGYKVAPLRHLSFITPSVNNCRFKSVKYGLEEWTAKQLNIYNSRISALLIWKLLWLTSCQNSTCKNSYIRDVGGSAFWFYLFIYKLWFFFIGPLLTHFWQRWYLYCSQTSRWPIILNETCFTTVVNFPLAETKLAIPFANTNRPAARSCVFVCAPLGGSCDASRPLLPLFSSLTAVSSSSFLLFLFLLPRPSSPPSSRPSPACVSLRASPCYEQWENAALQPILRRSSSRRHRSSHPQQPVHPPGRQWGRRRTPNIELRFKFFTLI